MGNTATGGDSGKRTVRLDVLYPDPRKKTATMAKKEPSVVLSSNKPDWKTCSQLQQLASTAWKRQTSKKQASETTPMTPKSPRKVAKKEDVEQKNRRRLTSTELHHLAARKQMQAKLDAFRNPLRASAWAKYSDDSSDDSSDEVVHEGVECDASGMFPIVGVRYKKIGENYDLCQTEYYKLSHAARQQFVRIDRPKSVYCDAGTGSPYRHHQPHQVTIGKPQARVIVSTHNSASSVGAATPFSKTWRVRNTGATPWPADTALVHVGGDCFKLSSVSVPAAAPGEEVEIVAHFLAPAQEGRYVSYWRLASGAKFGQRLWLEAIVQPVSIKDGDHAEHSLPGPFVFTNKPDSDNYADCGGTYVCRPELGKLNGDHVFVCAEKERFLACSGGQWVITGTQWLDDILKNQGAFGGFHGARALNGQGPLFCQWDAYECSTLHTDAPPAYTHSDVADATTEGEFVRTVESVMSELGLEASDMTPEMVAEIQLGLQAATEAAQAEAASAATKAEEEAAAAAKAAEEEAITKKTEEEAAAKAAEAAVAAKAAEAEAAASAATTAAKAEEESLAEQLLTNQLVAMGFEHQMAVKVLQASNGDVERAVNFMLQHPSTDKGEPAEQAAAIEPEWLEEWDQILEELVEMGFECEESYRAMIYKHHNLKDA